ncbi:MAG TPA: hypothetical protein P5210_03210 [Draconibacterium sp.]|nr:hypothetical protein [Draconibacterium sp.]
MKKVFLLMLVVIGVVSTLSAQFTRKFNKNWSVGIGAGVSYNEDKSVYSPLQNAYIVRYINPSADIMLENRLTYNEGIDIINPLLNLKYKFNNGYLFDRNIAIKPFLTGGPGYMWKDGANGFNFDGGGGFKFQIKENMNLCITGVYIKNIAEISGVDMTDDHWQVSCSVEIVLVRK